MTARVSPLAPASIVVACLFPPAGIVLGHLALRATRPGRDRGRPAAIVGTVLGYLFTVVALAGIVAMTMQLAQLAGA